MLCPTIRFLLVLKIMSHVTLLQDLPARDIGSNDLRLSSVGELVRRSCRASGSAGNSSTFNPLALSMMLQALETDKIAKSLGYSILLPMPESLKCQAPEAGC